MLLATAAGFTAQDAATLVRLVNDPRISLSGHRHRFSIHRNRRGRLMLASGTEQERLPVDPTRHRRTPRPLTANHFAHQSCMIHPTSMTHK